MQPTPEEVVFGNNYPSFPYPSDGKYGFTSGTPNPLYFHYFNQAYYPQNVQNTFMNMASGDLNQNQFCPKSDQADQDYEIKGNLQENSGNPMQMADFH